MTINELIELTDSIYKPCCEHNNAFVLYAFIPSIKRSMLPRSLQNLLKKNKAFYIQLLEDTQKNFPIASSTPEPERLKDLITEAFEHIRWKAYRADYTVDYFSTAKKRIVYTGGKPEITLSPEFNDLWHFIDTNGQHITNEKGAFARNDEMSPQVIDDETDLEHFKEYIRESLDDYLTGKKKTASEIGYEQVKDDTSAATKTGKKKVIAPIEISFLPDPTLSFFQLPTGAPAHYTLYLLNTNKDFPEKQYNGARYIETIAGKDGLRQMTFGTSKTGSIIITIDDIQKHIDDEQSNASKMLNFILIAGKNEILNWEEHPTNFIQFDLNDLVDVGMYKSIRTARKGFKMCMKILEAIQIEVNDKYGGFARTRIFTGSSCPGRQSVCTVGLSDFIDWSAFAKYYTYLPKEYFALPSKSSILCYYIFYRARQEVTAATAKNKTISFSMSYKSIADMLYLPKPGETKDLRGKTIEAIDRAITEIEDILKTADITITPIYDESKTAAEIYKTGKIEIVLKGSYSENFLGLAENKLRIEKKKEREKKKKERKNAKKVTL